MRSDRSESLVTTRRTRRPDRRRLKALRSYTIEEVARTLEIHRNTSGIGSKLACPSSIANVPS